LTTYCIHITFDLVFAVGLAAFELWWMRSFASQGQASSLNRFRFDDIAYCVASYRVLAIKPCILNWYLNYVYSLLTCYVQVLYLWLYVTIKTQSSWF